MFRKTFILLLLLASTSLAFDDPPVPPPKAEGQQWSIAILPDPQGYNQTYDMGGKFEGRGYQYKDRFPAQVRWIVENREKFNIRFAVEVGDSVQNFGYDEKLAEAEPGSNNHKRRGEWLNAVAGINLFHTDGDPEEPALIPFAVAIGNHDYTNNNKGDLTSTEYERFFGPGRFNDADGRVKKPFADWYLGNDRGWKYELNGKVVATGAGRNSAQIFEAAGRKFLHLTLECAVTDEGIAWAKMMLARHPDLPTIISTHSFIDGIGKILTPDRMGRKVGGPNPTNDTQQIFDKLIRENDRIFLVLCGHMWLQEHVVMTNAKGHPVHVMEQCYHLMRNGGRIDVTENPGDWIYKGESDKDRNGSGWMTLLMFDPDAKTITRYTYSPVLGAWAADRAAQPPPTSYPTGDDVVERFEFDFEGRFGRMEQD
jgi:hypothetical protein